GGFVFFSSRRRHTRFSRDWSSDVCSSDLEQGLLGMAFHPDYATNRFIFVNYTDNQGNTRIARYKARKDFDSVNRNSRKEILKVRSEERRVGKERRPSRQACHEKKMNQEVK